MGQRCLDDLPRVVNLLGGGVEPGALDGRGRLFGDHAGGGGESGGPLGGGSQDVEDVADEHLVDAFEVAAQDLVAERTVSNWPSTVATAWP
ncbi:MAG: hypothetical protein OXH75_16305 [Acidobacteria bacterium]|nr:hypothetical protein [Acidobacteriota bacterium]